MWRLFLLLAVGAVGVLLAAASSPTAPESARSARLMAVATPREDSEALALSVPQALRDIGSDDPHTRHLAATRLVLARGEAVPSLLARLLPRPKSVPWTKASEWLERATVMYALQQMGESIWPALVEAHAVKALRRYVVELFMRQVEENPEALRQLLPFVAKGDYHAVAAMGDLGPQAAESIPLLVKLLREGTRSQTASLSLWEMGRLALPALLAEFDRHPTDEVAALLSKLGPLAASAVPKLIELGSHKAANALGRIGPAARIAAPLLARKGGIGDLMRVGAGDSWTWPLVRKRLAGGWILDPHEAVAARSRAVSVFPRLDANLRQHRVHFWGAVNAYKALGRDIVPDLMLLAEDHGRPWRARYVRALGAIGDPKAIPLLRSLLFDKDIGVQHSAMRALRHMRAVGAANDLPGLFSGSLRVEAAVTHHELTGNPVLARRVFRDLAARSEAKHFFSGVENLLDLGDDCGEYVPRLIARLPNGGAAALLSRTGVADPHQRMLLVPHLSASSASVGVRLAALLADHGEQHEAVLRVCMEGVRRLPLRRRRGPPPPWCGRSAEVRSLAARTLGKLGERCAAPVLHAVRFDGGTKKAASEALTALGLDVSRGAD